jgi:hypothetical protein
MRHASYSPKSEKFATGRPDGIFLDTKGHKGLGTAEISCEELMAGHSKFKNIMHKKGRADAVRSKLFSKLSRDITVAAKMGLPDPAMNSRLRLAVAMAKAESMPNTRRRRADR